MSFFLAALISGLCFRFIRGCAKWVVLAGLLSLIAVRDPILWQQFVVLASQAYQAFREFILSL
jgi:hypothetical protein